MTVIYAAAPAKINSFLHVHQQRDDGFHELRTHFQLIDLCDELTFAVNDSGHIKVNNPAVDVDASDDLCYRAAALLQPYNEKRQGVTITVNKRIPAGGGLGGGSSDSATVLVVLNKLWGIGLPESKLLTLGLQLGSDVPIFIYGKTTFASGRGEIFFTGKHNNYLESKTIIIVKPPVQVSTAKIFQSRWLTKRKDTGTIRDLDTVTRICSGENDFQSVVFRYYPEIAQIAQRLSIYSPAHLTGTGACLYTVLDDVKKADRIICALERDCRVFVTNAITQSPLNEFT